MPIYPYRCPNGHIDEVWFASWRDATDTRKCRCGALSKRYPGVPAMWTEKAVNDTDEIWEGTPLQGTDGVNPEGYEAKKLYFGI